MAYHITYGTSALYEAGSADRAVHDMKMGLSADGASTLDLTVPPTHPLLPSLKVHDFAHLIDVTFDGRLLFRGFITRMDVNMWNEVAVHCESEISMLGWVLAVDAEPTAKTASGMLKWCVDKFNSYMSSAVGSSWTDWLYYCPIDTYDDDVGYPCKELGDKHAIGETPASPASMMSLLADNAVSKYGCLLYLDYDRTANRKTVVLKKGTTGTASQTIRIGENLTDYAQSSTTEPLYTGCDTTGASVSLDATIVYPSSTPIVVAYSAAEGDTSVSLQIANSNIDYYSLSSGDTLVFGSASEDGKWTSEMDADHMIWPTPLATPVAIKTPLPTSLAAGSVVGYIPSGWDKRSRPLNLSDITDRTVVIGGRTYKKVGRFVYDTAAVARYGLKMTLTSDSDRILGSDLLSQAIHELRQNISPSFTLTIKGVDMAMYSSNRQHLRVGDSVRVISEPHDVDEVMLVRSMSVSPDNPAQTSYVIGKGMPTATGQIRGAYGATAAVKELLIRPNR